LEAAFLQAAKMQPNVDANLQNVIGVLYNIAGSYDKAIDAFRMAVSANPDVNCNIKCVYNIHT
jgi:hypothetical protein